MVSRLKWSLHDQAFLITLINQMLIDDCVVVKRNSAFDEVPHSFKTYFYLATNNKYILQY